MAMSKAATIRTKFATAAETARILGVSPSRAEELIKMVNGSGHKQVAHHGSSRFKASNSSWGKKQARTKTARASR